MLSPYVVIGALEGSTAIGWSDLSSIWTALTGQISSTTIVNSCHVLKLYVGFWELFLCRISYRCKTKAFGTCSHNAFIL